MKKVILPAVLDESTLVEFDLFPNKDSELVNNKIILKNLEASDELLNFVLRQRYWSAFYTGDTDKTIGYGSKDEVDGIGLTEANAYSLWLADFKAKERRFKTIIPLSSLSQTQYDALLSLYYHTGTISYVGSELRRFEIIDYIKQEKWNYVGTAMVYSGHQRLIRQQESSILMSAYYGRYKSRLEIKESGIQEMRRLYATLDDVQKKQAEYVYYAETKRFLPNMPELRKRQVVKLYEQNN